MGVINITINYNWGVDFPLCWSTCHMARVGSFISFAQFTDDENAVEHHVGPGLCYTPTDWGCTVGLQTETMQKKLHKFFWLTKFEIEEADNVQKQ